MGLIEAYRQLKLDSACNDSDLSNAIRQLGPKLIRINLQDPSDRVPQQCKYVTAPNAAVGGGLLLRVFHEQAKVIAIEVIVEDDQQGSLAFDISE